MDTHERIRQIFMLIVCLIGLAGLCYFSMITARP